VWLADEKTDTHERINKCNAYSKKKKKKRQRRRRIDSFSSAGV